MKSNFNPGRPPPRALSSRSLSGLGRDSSFTLEHFLSQVLPRLCWSFLLKFTFQLGRSQFSQEDVFRSVGNILGQSSPSPLSPPLEMVHRLASIAFLSGYHSENYFPFQVVLVKYWLISSVLNWSMWKSVRHLESQYVFFSYTHLPRHNTEWNVLQFVLTRVSIDFQKWINYSP